MSLQQRAREAHLRERVNSRDEEARRREAHYRETAERSSAELTHVLSLVLDIVPEEVLILRGPGGEGIALHVEDGLAFAAQDGRLLVTYERAGEPYPARSLWQPIGSLAELGAFIQRTGPAVAEPEGVR